AAANVGHRAEEATSSVGSGMRNLAGTLRETLPHEGMLGTAGSAMADTLERGGRYLEQEGLRGIGEDLTNVIRRNPIPALLLGIGNAVVLYVGSFACRVSSGSTPVVLLRYHRLDLCCRRRGVTLFRQTSAGILQSPARSISKSPEGECAMDPEPEEVIKQQML